MKIFKFLLNPLDKTDLTELSIPSDAEVVHFGQDPKGMLCMWVKLRADDDSGHRRRFPIVGTGHPFHPELKYLKTAVCDPFVWHLFEV